MFHYCDACNEPIREEATSIQVQSGQVVRMTDGSVRMNGRLPQYTTMCVPCGERVSSFIRTMLLHPVPR